MPVPCSPGMQACLCHAVPDEDGRRGHCPALGMWTYVYAVVRMLLSGGVGAPPFQKLGTALSGGQSAVLHLRLDSLSCEQSWQAQRAGMPLTPRTPCDTLKNSLLLRSPRLPTPALQGYPLGGIHLLPPVAG